MNEIDKLRRAVEDLTEEVRRLRVQQQQCVVIPPIYVPQPVPYYAPQPVPYIVPTYPITINWPTATCGGSGDLAYTSTSPNTHG